MIWPWRRKQPENVLLSVGDPILAEYFHVGAPNLAGVEVHENSVLGISAVYRAVAIVAGTIASLPLKTMRDVNGTTRVRVSSFLDNPGGPDGPTGYEWLEMVMLHLLLHGNAYLRHIYGGAGQLIALEPIHPLRVTVQWADVPGHKLFTATLIDGTVMKFDATTLTHIPAMSSWGLVGYSPIAIARNSLGTSIAGDRSAAKMFNSGALYSGLVTPEDDVDEDEAKAIKTSLDAKTGGWENAGAIAVVNRRLRFTPWTMNAKDAQFLESRQFQIQEIARWFGVPANLLMDPGAVSTWGAGVEIQNRGLARYTLAPWTERIEQRLSRLLPAPRFVEFDFAGLLQPAPEQEIPLLIQQVQAGLLTINEARRMRGMDPIDGGDAPSALPDPTQAVAA